MALEIDGQLYGIADEPGHEPEQFDGFDTAYPAMIVLRATDDEIETI